MISKPIKLTQDDWTRGSICATAMGLPLLLAHWLTWDMAVFIALGSLLTLILDPRCEPKMQSITMLGGMFLVVLSGILGALLAGHLELSILALIIIAFLAGQPKPEHPYFTLLGKFVVTALLLENMGISTSFNLAFSYFTGVVLALILTLVHTRLFKTQGTFCSPDIEWRQIQAGECNGPLYGFTLPMTILAASLTAHYLQAQYVAWVGITVLFVMHVHGPSAWERVWMRIAGTLLAVLASYVVISFFPSRSITFFLMLCALFIPSALRQNYLIFSALITMIILLLFDLAMLKQGGDKFLIQWRLFDTLIGCAWVAISLTLLQCWQRYGPKKPDVK